MRFIKSIALATCLAFGVVAGPAFSVDAFPGKPIRILVPFSAGALTDIIARFYAKKLTESLGQPVVVENRPGASGMVASQMLLGSPADGYTLLFVSSSHAVNPSLHKKLTYDTLKDFSGVALLASSPSVVVVKGSDSVRNLQDLITRAKAKPNGLTYGSAGIGAATHLVGAYFDDEAHVQMLHVPFKGVQEAVREVMSNRVDVAYPPIALALPYVKSGQLRALALTSAQRNALMPDTPTVAESGIANFEYTIWYGVVARAGTPPATMKRLADEIERVGKMPDIQQALAAQGLAPQNLALGDFDRYIASEVVKLGKIVKQAGVDPD